MRYFNLSYCFGLVLTLMLGTTVAQAQTTTCELTPTTSTFSVHTEIEGLLSVLAHKRLIQATKFEGKIVYVQDEIKNSHVELLIETNGLLPTDMNLSESDRTDIIANMRESLDATSYPTMHFNSQTVTPIKDGIRVVGTLRMKGTAKQVIADVKLKRIEHILVSTANLRLNKPPLGSSPTARFWEPLK